MRLSFATAAIGLFLMALPVQAADLRNSQSLVVGKAERLQQNLYAAGQSVSIEGETTGDTLAAGWQVSLPGRVGEDAALAGMTVMATGEIGGDLRVAGRDITVSGAVGGETIIFGSSVQVLGTASLAGDLIIYAESVTLSGDVGGNARIVASTINITGHVAGDADLQAVDTLTVGDTASVAGTTTYLSPKEQTMPTGLASAQYHGPVNASDARVPGRRAHKDGKDFGDWAVSLAMAIAAGLVFFLLSRRSLEAIAVETREHFWKRAGLGFLVLVALPLTLVTLIVTLIGIPVAMIAALAYLVFTLVAWAAAGSVVGLFVCSRVVRLQHRPFDWMTVVGGTLVLHVLAAVPVLGSLLNFVVTMAIEGVLFLLAWKHVSAWFARR